MCCNEKPRQVWKTCSQNVKAADIHANINNEQRSCQLIDEWQSFSNNWWKVGENWPFGYLFCNIHFLTLPNKLCTRYGRDSLWVIWPSCGNWFDPQGQHPERICTDGLYHSSIKGDTTLKRPWRGYKKISCHIFNKNKPPPKKRFPKAFKNNRQHTKVNNPKLVYFKIKFKNNYPRNHSLKWLRTPS